MLTQAQNRALDAFLEASRRELFSSLPVNPASVIYHKGMDIRDLTQRVNYFTEVLRALKTKETDRLRLLSKYKRIPVGIREFVLSPQYLDKAGEVYPAVLDELETMNGDQYQEIVLTGGIGPLSCDTEFLTPNGWVRMDSWKGQEVGEYNAETGALEFRHPEKYEVRPCKELLHFTSKYSVDMKLSEHHRVLFRNTKGALCVWPASRVAETMRSSANGFCGKFITTFNYSGGGVLLTNAQLRVQVAVQADGSFDKRRPDSPKCRIFLKKERKKVRMRLLLQEAGIDYIERSVPRDGYSLFIFEAPLRSKSYAWAWPCTLHQCSVITEEVNHWDGSFSDGRFATTDKESADFIQFAYAVQGLRSSISISDNSSSLCMGEAKPLYRVGCTERNEPSLQSKTGASSVKVVEAEDGKMYCFATKTGFFVARHNGRVFVTGNSAKTTCALYTTAYQVYLLSCLANPHKEFGLDSSSEILFVFQSINSKISKASFDRFKDMIDQSPYFKNNFKPDKDLSSKLVFPNRIEVVPVSGAETAAIGQNVIGGFIDELNYMQVTERSKQSVDGGTYDQAVALYNSIARRRKSRFMAGGVMPGKLCLVSSKRYPGQFTDLKEDEAKRDPTIYIYDKRVWEIKPEGSFSGKWFRVFIGTEDRKPRVIKEDEEITEDIADKIMSIPIEFKEDFDKDIVNSLREIAGVSTLARHPFFIDVERVKESFKPAHRSILSEPSVDFVQTQLKVFPDLFYRPDLPRYVHIDLAVTGDSAGVCIGTCTGFKSMKDLGYGLSEEMVPQIHIDGILEVKPPRNGEILFWKIRNLITVLAQLGLNIKWVSFDSYQSVDSMQLLRQQGFSTGRCSMDTSTEPYDLLKTVIYTGSLSAPEHAKCRKELISLEKIAKTGKIDHPANSSKDCSDALAGVAFGLYKRREIWGLHGVKTVIIRDGPKMSSDTMAGQGVSVVE